MSARSPRRHTPASKARLTALWTGLALLCPAYTALPGATAAPVTDRPTESTAATAAAVATASPVRVSRVLQRRGLDEDDLALELGLESGSGSGSESSPNERASTSTSTAEPTLTLEPDPSTVPTVAPTPTAGSTPSAPSTLAPSSSPAPEKPIVPAPPPPPLITPPVATPEPGTSPSTGTDTSTGTTTTSQPAQPVAQTLEFQLGMAELGATAGDDARAALKQAIFDAITDATAPLGEPGVVDPATVDRIELYQSASDTWSRRRRADRGRAARSGPAPQLARVVFKPEVTAPAAAAAAAALGALIDESSLVFTYQAGGEEVTVTPMSVSAGATGLSQTTSGPGTTPTASGDGGDGGAGSGGSNAGVVAGVVVVVLLLVVAGAAGGWRYYRQHADGAAVSGARPAAASPSGGRRRSSQLSYAIAVEALAAAAETRQTLVENDGFAEPDQLATAPLHGAADEPATAFSYDRKSRSIREPSKRHDKFGFSVRKSIVRGNGVEPGGN